MKVRSDPELSLFHLVRINCIEFNIGFCPANDLKFNLIGQIWRSNSAAHDYFSIIDKDLNREAVDQDPQFADSVFRSFRFSNRVGITGDSRTGSVKFDEFSVYIPGKQTVLMTALIFGCFQNEFGQIFRILKPDDQFIAASRNLFIPENPI